MFPMFSKFQNNLLHFLKYSFTLFYSTTCQLNQPKTTATTTHNLNILIHLLKTSCWIWIRWFNKLGISCKGFDGMWEIPKWISWNVTIHPLMWFIRRERNKQTFNEVETLDFTIRRSLIQSMFEWSTVFGVEPTHSLVAFWDFLSKPL